MERLANLTLCPFWEQARGPGVPMACGGAALGLAFPAFPTHSRTRGPKARMGCRSRLARLSTALSWAKKPGNTLPENPLRWGLGGADSGRPLMAQGLE